MFSPLGLFSGVPCPDALCKRRPCLFSHDPNVRTEKIGGDEPTSKTVARLQARPTEWKPPPQRSIALSTPTPYTSSPASSSRLMMGPTAATSTAGPSRTSLSGLNIKIPVLQINSRLSRQPAMDRRKGLERLFEEYKRIYSKILPLHLDLAADHALAEEMAVSFGTTVASYSSAIRSACMSIRSRDPPGSTSSRFCGTIAEVKARTRKWEEDQKSKLTRDKVKRYLMTREQMDMFGYIYACPPGQGSTHTTCLGERKMCDRCGTDFTVRGPEEQRWDPHPPCVYHWGKATMERIDGVRMQRWSCCGSDRTLSEPGCAIAEFHVFKDGKSWKFSDRRGVTDLQAEARKKEDETVILHSRQAFVSTMKVLREIREEDQSAGNKRKRREEPHEVVAMDCEMICKQRHLVSVSAHILHRAHSGSGRAG